MRSAVMLAIVGVASSLRVPTLPATTQQACKTALVAGLCSASLSFSMAPANAVPPSIESVIVESTEAAYPIIGALDEGFPGFTELLGKIILDIGPKKLGPAIDRGVDVFNSVPDEKVKAFNGVVKEAFAGLSTDSCTLVPLPSSKAASRFTSMAQETVSQAKLKEFSDKYGSTLAALAKTDSKICLPSKDNLNKLALAQADIGRAFDYDKVNAFSKYVGPVFKGEARLTDETMGLLVSAKSQAPDATYQDRVNFEKAGKKLEAAAKKEKEKNAAARYKAKMAAEAEAKKAAKAT
jgi:hypothetical protein